MPDIKWSDDKEFAHISGSVNILTEIGVVGTAAYNSKEKMWFMGGLVKETGYISFDKMAITHWQPLPEPL